jgi:hypothetical protein
MAWHYQSKYIVCPFYRRTDTNRICCEGVDDENTINLVFGSQSRMLEYAKTYCESIENYQHCRICQMLNEKWEGKT